MDASELRRRFCLDPALVFLNHGSFGACPREVMAEQRRWQEQMERNPVEFLGRRSGELLEQVRQRLAAFLGTQAHLLALLTNATTGVNLVARSLPWQPGDEILTTDHEYGACRAAWQFVAQREGLRLRTVAIPLPFERETFVERVMAQVSARTRLIFLSHLTSTTALIFPVQDLCRTARERGILTLVDGAHAPGHVPLALDALGADFYTGNAHKWLCAPKGAAFLHARAEHHALLHAPTVSWGYVAEGMGGHTGFDAYTGQTLLQRRLQWQGTHDPSAWLSLPAAIDFCRQHLSPAVRQRAHDRAVALMHRLRTRWSLPPIGGDDDFGQMVPIPLRCESPELLRQRLFAESGIEVPITQHVTPEGTHTLLRVSVQGYTTDAELQALVDAPALQ